MQYIVQHFNTILRWSAFYSLWQRERIQYRVTLLKVKFSRIKLTVKKWAESKFQNVLTMDSSIFNFL